jgi:streptogramin lyase
MRFVLRGLALGFVVTAAGLDSTAAAADLLVSSFFSGAVQRYDGETGAFIGTFASGGGLSGAEGLGYGPNGDLYVVSRDNARVLRFDGQTGGYLDTFFSGTPLVIPQGLLFDADAHVYVNDAGTNVVQRFDVQTGQYLGEFASNGWLLGPFGMVFGSSGDLYVSSVGRDSILRFDGQTGALVGRLTSSDLDGPTGIRFGPEISTLPVARITLWFGSPAKRVSTSGCSLPAAAYLILQTCFLVRMETCMSPVL